MSKKSSGGHAELALPLALPLAGLGLNVSLGDEDIAANKEPQGVGSGFFLRGGSTHYFANANSHANCRFCFFCGGEGSLPITSQMQIPMQIVVSPLGHFGRSHTPRQAGQNKWQAVSRRWSTSNTGTHQEEPHTRITADLDLGGQGTSSVSHSSICFHGPPSLHCHTNTHLHWTRPALKGLSGQKKHL